MPTQPSPATEDQPEVFRLSDDCQGVIMRQENQWIGFLRWESNQVGPFNNIVGARLAVRSEFVAAIAPRDMPIVRRL